MVIVKSFSSLPIQSALFPFPRIRFNCRPIWPSPSDFIMCISCDTYIPESQRIDRWLNASTFTVRGAKLNYKKVHQQYGARLSATNTYMHTLLTYIHISYIVISTGCSWMCLAKTAWADIELATAGFCKAHQDILTRDPSCYHLMYSELYKDCGWSTYEKL